ncbi:hypothetical protein BDB01DRAFT_773524 [Pilobolus umbonatus]|nr:hypothetical protein BDB01DRAFT_773524 [Pilobolus umbonatus]
MEASYNTHTRSTQNDNDEDVMNQSYVRKRTRATADQLTVLEDTFSVNVSPNSKLRKQLSDQLKMSERSIQIWFQNRRAKVKHMQKRAQMQMQQAAIRAQLYHYQQHQQQQQQQQQQYSMLPYGPTVMSVPSSFYNQQPAMHYVPHYARRVQLPPRALSVDSLSNYNQLPSDIVMSQSSFPTPGPEPLITSEFTTSPSYFHSTIPNSGNGWSVSPEFQNDNSIKMYRQSIPSYTVQSLSHHRLSEDNILADLGSGNDFPDYIHGQISPSPSPGREEFDISTQFSPIDHDNNLSSSSSSVTFLADTVSHENQTDYFPDSHPKWTQGKITLYS